jgi:Tfp pilus assembly protein PilF
LALAAVTLRGVVLENKPSGNTVGNVSVSAVGAHRTTTGADGQFVLHFPARQPGEDVSINVSRKGWEVVNDLQLKHRLPLNSSQSSLEILIAKAAERERWALQFYRLQGERVVDASYKPKLATADPGERARLLRERDQARAQADELARQLATRPVGSGGEDYQKAASLFLEGKMDAALEILSEERLRQQEEETKKRQEDTMRSWLLRGQMLAVKFDFDKAAFAYGEAVRFAPTSQEAWFGYAFFHQQQTGFRQAREGYGKALALARASGRDKDVAWTLHNLGFLNQQENRMTEAREAYDEAIELYRKLADKNPDVYLANVALTLNNLGLLNQQENHMTEARKAYDAALKLYRKLAQKNPDVYLPYVATVLNNLGDLHRDENHMNDAQAAYEEALKIRRTLVRQNPDAYLPDVAVTLNNLGVLHVNENRMNDARAAFEESLEIYLAFAKVSPAAYEPYVRLVQDNLDALNSEQKEKR